MGAWMHHVVWGGLTQTVCQLLYLVGPLFLLGLLLHRLESLVQGRLSRRFGWNSILWTGWLGTPVHELSHAAFCVAFRHRIVRMALFEPDPVSRRLGYVHHAFNPKSRFQVAGNFFIGTAPLAGGALALYGLLWLFDPDAARQALSAGAHAPALAGGDLLAAARVVWDQTFGLISRVMNVEHLGSVPFWLFMYLVLCVGSHLAPSRADYRGTGKGGLIVLGTLLAFNVLFLALGGGAGRVAGAMAAVLGPVLALFVLAAVLCGLATAAVCSLTVASSR